MLDAQEFQSTAGADGGRVEKEDSVNFKP